MNESPKEMLELMLGYLGFMVEIQEQPGPDGVTLQIFTAESDRLIGRDGQTLEDLQYLLNRVTQKCGHSERIVVDVEHYRTMRNDDLISRARLVADQVRETGVAQQLDPMNSYDRRLIHNAFVDDPDVMTWSPKDDARLKRITIKRRD